MRGRLQTLIVAFLLASTPVINGEQIEVARKAVRAKQHHAQALSQQTHKKGAKGFHTMTLKDFHEKTRPEDEGRTLEIFYNNYEHHDHSVYEIDHDMDKIKVMTQKSRRKNGRKCQPLDWVTVHWKTYTDHDHKLEDSRQFKTKQPSVFQIGMYQMPKCWDITTSYMHAGQELKISCPSELAYGGTPKYGHFNHDMIPADSPLVFVLDVLECQPTVDKINEVNKKAKNNAPMVQRHGRKIKSSIDAAGDAVDTDDDKQDEAPPPSKKDMSKIKQQVKNMKQTIQKQKKKLKKDEDDTHKMEDDINGSQDKDQKKNAQKMMIKQEKVLKEEKIIKREKKQVKSVKKLIKKAENPTAAKKQEEEKEKQKNPEDKPAEKGKHERHTDSSGKPLVPNPPPFDCFYIKYPQKDSKGQDLVLEADTKDKYYPKKTGLYNFFLHPLGNSEEEEADDHHANHEIYQQWHYDTTTHKLSIKAFKSKVMFQGNNRNLVLYVDKSMKNQFFSFDADNGVWYNEYSDQGIMIDHNSEVESGANIITAPRNNMKNLERMRWKMVPCAEVQKEKHHGEKHHDEKENSEKDDDHHEEEEHHDEDKDDESEDDDHDEEEDDDQKEEHPEKHDEETDDEDHEAAQNESNLKKAKEDVKTIVEKKKQEKAHHETEYKAEEKHDTEKKVEQHHLAEKKGHVTHKSKKKSNKSKETPKSEAVIVSKKDDNKKNKKTKSEEETKQDVEKEDKQDERLEQKKQSMIAKPSKQQDDDATNDKEESAKSSDEEQSKSTSKKANASNLHQIKSKSKKHKNLPDPVKVEKQEKKQNEPKIENGEKEVRKDKKQKKEKKDKKHKKQKNTNKKKTKSAKKHKKQEQQPNDVEKAKKQEQEQIKALEQMTSKKQEDEQTDDIMEKFEESLGKDDLAPFESLHQKETSKEISRPADESSTKKEKVQSADSDVVDNENQFTLKKNQGLQEQKKSAKESDEPLSVEEEDRLLEKRLSDLKKQLNE